MASNITNTSAFTTANMKPVADEVITADWGQKMAENTGYLYANPLSAPALSLGFAFAGNSVAQRTSVGTAWFIKPTFCGTLNGTVSFSRDLSGSSDTQYAKIWLDGTAITPANQGTLSATGVQISTYGFTKSISHLVNGSPYTFSSSLSAGASTTNTVLANVNITTYFTP